MAEHFLDQYIIQNLPFNLSEEWQRYIKSRAMDTLILTDWFCGAQDFRELISNHTSLFFAEALFLLFFLLTFVHAWRNGGRYLYAWIAICFHGLLIETLCIRVKDFENFWHAQSLLTFFGRRVPLYVLCGTYHTIMYPALVAAKRMRLPWWAEGAAAALFAVMIDLPLELAGVKLLWWSFHDTDPNVAGRFFWAPYTALYFHAAATCAFVWLLRLTRRLFVPADYDWRLCVALSFVGDGAALSFVREFVCALTTGLGAVWCTGVFFAPIHHVFHDMYGVSAACTFGVFASLLAVAVWAADRRPARDARLPRGRRFFDELGVVLVLHYLFFVALFAVAEPQHIVANGLHQPIGPCDVTEHISAVTGYKLHRKKFLCPTRYDEKYFDFHCLPERRPPKMTGGQPVEWYAICGTPFDNRVEYMFVAAATGLVFLSILYQALACSGDTPFDPVKVRKRKAD